jgi:hypothetical protein
MVRGKGGGGGAVGNISSQYLRKLETGDVP